MPFRRTYSRGDAVDPVVTDDAVEDRSVSEPTAWSPAQIIGLIVGIGFTVLGIAAIATTGFHTNHIYTPHDMVWHLWHSPLLALCEIGFGVLMIIASVVPGGSRELMAFLGAISLAFGIVVLTNAAQDNIVHWTGVTHANGWLFTIVGGVMLLVALLSPTFLTGGASRRRRVVTHA